MRQSKHFNINEREAIFKMLATGESIRSIPKHLKRSPSSVSRELKRNSINDYYSPSKAQATYKINKSKCGAKRILSNPAIHKKVQNLLLNFQWSPEQISNRLRLESYSILISNNTIY